MIYGREKCLMSLEENRITVLFKALLSMNKNEEI